jgi:hypothetical protein
VEFAEKVENGNRENFPNFSFADEKATWLRQTTTNGEFFAKFVFEGES